MEPRDYVTVLWDRWLLLVGFAFSGIAIALGLTLATRLYSAQATTLVSITAPAI